MFSLLASLPVPIIGVIVALLLFTICCGGLLLSAMYGPRARLQKRLNAVVGMPQDAGKRVRVSQEKRLNVEAKIREIERLKNSKRGYRLNEEIVQAGMTQEHF